MEIRLEEKTVREIYNGYCDNAENGVVAYGGKLNVRPAFQREFVYNGNQTNPVRKGLIPFRTGFKNY